MGMYISFIGATTEELDRAVKAPDRAEDDVDELFGGDDSTVPGRPSAELDKMWDGLQFLLGEAGVGREFMMEGFLIVEEGTLFGWSVEQVEAVARQLRATPWERLAPHFDPERMIKEKVYPHVWDVAPQSELEWLESAYGDLVEFFGAAADRGLGAFMTFTAGADVNARFTGAHRETPLHWAASTDDVPVLDALLDLGADIEADGAVIGGGTPLADAVAFGQWRCARRLVERGARTTLWQAAALGAADRVAACLTSETDPPTAEDITNALWCACHGGQRETAEHLLRRGGDVNWVGHDRLTALDAADRAGHGTLVGWLREQGAKSAAELV